MKNSMIAFLAMVLAFGSCTTGSYVQDDAYYSRKKSISEKPVEVASTPAKSELPATSSSNTTYDYQSYAEEPQLVTEGDNAVYTTTETVVEPDGTSYSTTETYYDSDYAQRIRRFNSGLTTSFGYYDSFNTGCFDCYNSSLSFGFGYPYGFGFSYGFNYGWPYYYGYSPYWGYDPFWGSSWYSPWGWGGYYNGYYNGFWDGYYYGGGYYEPGYYRPRTQYGHRGSHNGGSTIPGNRRPSDNNNVNASYSSPRGDRSNASSSGSNIVSGGSERGSNSGQMSRPSVQDKSSRPASTARPRPSTQEKLDQYREKYARPNAGNTREQRYQRPKAYSSPASRTPKSSTEYVKPGSSNSVRQNTQNTAPALNQQRSNSNGVSRPAQNNGNLNRSTPTRSSGNSSPNRSISQPSRSSSTESRSFSPSSSSSGSSSRSSGGSYSGGSSSGSSRSSGGGSSSGGRR